MLSNADAALVRRDPAIAGLATLLDADAFAAALQAALPAAGVRAATATYVRYKPGVNCLVAYELTTAHGLRRAYARAYAAALRNKLAHVQRLQHQPGDLGSGGCIIANQDIAVYSWPHDQALPALAGLFDAERRAALLQHLAKQHPRLQDGTLTNLRYRPQRRYVGRLDGAHGQAALLKLYCERDYARACTAAAFRSRGPLGVAPLLGAAAHHRALLFAWQPGQVLTDNLWAVAWHPTLFATVGAALAALHAQEQVILTTSAQDDLDTLDAAVKTIATLCPDLEKRVRTLAHIIAAELSSPGKLCPIHGDFYADQVLVDGERVIVLDLDNAAWGDPALDLGTFAAHLWRRVSLGSGTAERATQITAALLAGYAQQQAPPDRHRLALHTAAGLLRLAPEPFRYRHTHWPERIRALVAAAEEIAIHETICV